MYNTDFLIPTKFLTLVAHLAILITLLWSSQESAKICLPESYTDESFRSHHQQIITGLSLSLALIVFELFSFFTGLTMFHTSSAFLSIGCHGSACLILSYIIFDSWKCGWYWIIFGFFSVIPALNDLLIIGTMLFKKLH